MRDERREELLSGSGSRCVRESGPGAPRASFVLAQEPPGDAVLSVTFWGGFGSTGASIFGFCVPSACVPARRRKSRVGSGAEPFI